MSKLQTGFLCAPQSLFAALAAASVLITPAFAQQAPALRPAAPVQPKLVQPKLKPAESAPPVRTETVVYDNWVLTCRERMEKSSKRICSVSLQITESKSKQDIFLWQIGQDSTGAPTYLIRTPLGVRLKDGVQIAFGAGKPWRADFVACGQSGCEAIAPFGDALSKELAAANEGTATFILTDGKTINIKLPLAGASQALPALKR